MHTAGLEAGRASRDKGEPAEPRTSWASAALVTSGLLLALYPTIRPWHDESTLSGATAAMSSGAWVAAHVLAMGGLILLPLGLLGLSGLFTSASRRLWGVATSMVWVGAGLSLPYYGAEDYALHAIAQRAADGHRVDLLGLVDDIRFGPVASTMFAVGLVLLACGGVLAAVALWRSGISPRWIGVPLGIGLALFLPQFFFAPWARIAHGWLLAGALGLLATMAPRAARHDVRRTGTGVGTSPRR